MELNDKYEEIVEASQRPPLQPLFQRPPSTVVEWGLYPSFWNVVPVTIEMLRNAPRAAKHIPGCLLIQGHKPVRRVELCGTITEWNSKHSHTVGKLDDGTGIINLRWSVDEDEILYGPSDSEDIKLLRSTLKLDAKIFVTGKLNDFLDEMEVIVDYCRLISNENEPVLFRETISRIHGLNPELYPVSMGFEVPTDPSAFSCIVTEPPTPSFIAPTPPLPPLQQTLQARPAPPPQPDFTNPRHVPPPASSSGRPPAALPAAFASAAAGTAYAALFGLRNAAPLQNSAAAAPHPLQTAANHARPQGAHQQRPGPAAPTIMTEEERRRRLAAAAEAYERALRGE